MNSGKPRHWFDATFFLDDPTGGPTVSWWALPPEKYLDFGDANQALFTFQARVLGLGAELPELTLMVQRTRIQGPDDDRFGDALLPTGTNLDAGLTHGTLVLGRENVSNLDAGGVARVTVQNDSGSADAGAMVELRVWVALARYERNRTAVAMGSYGRAAGPHLGQGQRLRA